MITVLQIIPSLNSGGAEQAVVDMTAGLRQAGHRAIVVSSGGIRERDIDDAGGKHITRSVDTKNPLLMLLNALWLKQIIHKHKVNIVHARSRAPAWTAFWATRMARPTRAAPAFVTTFHAAYKFSNPFKKFYNSVMSKGERVIAISDFIAGHIHDVYGTSRDKIRIIPRGIDLFNYNPNKVSEDRKESLRRAWGIRKDDTVILLPSRLSPIKGQKTLIDAMSIMPSSMPNITAIITGDDQGRANYRRALNEMIAARNLGDRVKVVMRCDDMPAAYMLATLVVAPSLVPEGFGRVPVEAMIMGIPVIATDIGGYKETVRPGETGWLVPPGDPQKLAETILHALRQTPVQRAAMGEMAKLEAHTRYDKLKMVADTLSVYSELTVR